MHDTKAEERRFWASEKETRGRRKGNCVSVSGFEMPKARREALMEWLVAIVELCELVEMLRQDSAKEGASASTCEQREQK